MCGVSGNNFYFGLGIATTVFLVAFVLNQFNLIGGGDVKLLFPILLFAESNLNEFVMGTSVAGILLSLGYLLFPRRILLTREKIIGWLKFFFGKKRKCLALKIILPSFARVRKSVVPPQKCVEGALGQRIPYGVAISIGGLCVIAESLLFG
jgi:Flp pilus assembly protein protease CpaA